MGLERRIAVCLWIVIIGLVLSGATAIPLERELDLLAPHLDPHTAMGGWLAFARDGLRETYAKYPFVAYGTDWLAFAHFVLALLFIGPLRDPVKNIWVIDFGLIACLLVPPTALIFGHFRGIPLFHRLIDCSFGVGGFVPLWLARRWTLALAARLGT